MSDVVLCPNCQAKNRLRPAAPTRADQRPRCGRCGAPLPWLVDADEASFEHEVAAPMPVLVDFWAPWCGPCRSLTPVLEDLSRELAGRLKVVKVDVDQNPGLAARFDARSIPLLVLLQGGQVCEKLVGAQPEAALRQALAPYL